MTSAGWEPSSPPSPARRPFRRRFTSASADASPSRPLRNCNGPTWPTKSSRTTFQTTPPSIGRRRSACAAASAFLFTGKAPRQVGMDRSGAATAMRRRDSRPGTIGGRQAVGRRGGERPGPARGRPHPHRCRRRLRPRRQRRRAGLLSLTRKSASCRPSDRWQTPWQDYAWAPDVVLTPPGGRVGVLDLPANDAPALRGPQGRGRRRRRPADLPGAGRLRGVAGASPTATNRSIASRCRRSSTTSDGMARRRCRFRRRRAPAASYAIDLGTDEALETGATEVKFSKPLFQYVENFLNLPVGTVPALARYRRRTVLWTPGPAGRVVRVVGVKDGLAELDVDGKGQAGRPGDPDRSGRRRGGAPSAGRSCTERTGPSCGGCR